MQQKHEFTLYVPHLSDHISGNSLIIDSPELIHRIQHILRLKPTEELILFDEKINITIQIKEFIKKSGMQALILKKQNNIPLTPRLIFALPLLKKDAFETALYSLTEMGINQIQLLITEKSQQHWHQKDMQRAQRIIIAACEQSKNFNVPLVHQPIPFAKIISYENLMFFDPAGKPALSFLEQHKNILTHQQITLLIGPEGDLTPQEKNMLKITNVPFIALTPTILRACQAAGFATGLFRLIS